MCVCLKEREGERERKKESEREEGILGNTTLLYVPSTLSTRLLTLDPHNEQFCTMHVISVIDSKLRFPF